MSSFCKCKSYSHFFSKNISVYAIFHYQSFNDKLTNDIFSFEQLGPDNLGRKHTSEEFAIIFTREATSVDRNLVPQYFNQLKNEATLIAAPIEKAGKYFNV